MNKKSTVILSLVSAGIIALLAGIYIGLSFMYRGSFSYGTWINNEYCTGKSITEVNILLKAYTERPLIVISDKDGNDSYLYAGDYGFDADYTDDLINISKHQNPFLWIKNLFGHRTEITLEPVRSFDRDKLASLVKELPVYIKYMNMEEPVIKIINSDDGFELMDTSHELLDYDKITEAVMENALKGGALFVSDDFFYTQAPDAKERKTIEEWKKLQAFLATKIIYDMGAEQIPVDAPVLKNFLETDASGMYILDEKGNFKLNDEAITSFAEDLCARYDTATLPRKYVTYKGKEVKIDYALKGTLLDTAKEKEYLLEAVHNSTEEVHVPTYLREGFTRGENDIGSSFIEVDLTEQKLYFVKEGELLLETDIVSGNPNKGWTTPKMLCYIYAMSKDVVLRGEGYASPVDYWMPVYKGIGLHDASWQPAFGQDLYLTRGSRGCINLSRSDAKTVYDNAYVGLPVIIY